MSGATYHHPSKREQVAGLMTRLARVQAAGESLRTLVDLNHTGTSTVAAALETLEHELLLAAREADAARARITR
jgi:hypothetical protein